MPVTEHDVDQVPAGQSTRNPFSKATLAKLAACEAVGLEYWSDHPLLGRMWAVGPDRRFHIVRGYWSRGEAALQYEGIKRVQDRTWPYHMYERPTTYDLGERVKFSVSDSTGQGMITSL